MHRSVPRSASQQIEQMQHGQRTIPVLVTNGNADGSGTEQITLYRPYHDATNGPNGIDEHHFVQFQRSANSVSQQRLHDGHHTEMPMHMGASLRTDNMCRVQIVRAHSADTNPTTTTQLMTNNFTNDTHVSSTSDISNQCDVIEQTISNNTTIAQDTTTTTSNSTIAKPKHFSYTPNAIKTSTTAAAAANTAATTTNGLFHSYESIDDVIDPRYAMNLPMTAQLRTPSSHSIGHDAVDMLSLRNAAIMNDDDRYVSAVIERASKMEKSSSLPFSEESPINADMLSKKYGMRDFGDSMSGSAVSSLANFDYPLSPPQATTPTGEIRELLEQIRQLQENADSGKILVFFSLCYFHIFHLIFNNSNFLSDQQT